MAGARAANAPPPLPLTEVPTPSGWQVDDIDDLRIAVPPSWAVESAVSMLCPGPTEGVLFMGVPVGASICGSPAPAATVIAVSGVRLPLDAAETTAEVNGLEAELPTPQPAGAEVYAFPQLDATVTIGTTAPAGVLSSIGPSPEAIVLAPGPITPPPAGARTVSYNGVQLDVPGSWTTIDSEHSGGCVAFLPNEVLVGRNMFGGVSCLMFGPNHAEDGLWLQPGSLRADPETLPAPSGGTLQTDATSQDPVDLDLQFHGVGITLGLGPDPTVARAVYDSLRFRLGAPDTPRQGVCPTAAPRMPVPQRLSAPLSLDGGQYLLQPPAPGDQPAITAQEAWAQVSLAPGGSYQITLARYTASDPATVNKDGALTPFYANLLAWVIDGTVAQTPVGPCGGIGLTAINALTGQPIG